MRQRCLVAVAMAFEALAAAEETAGSAPGRRLAGRWPAAASGGRDGDDGEGSEGMASVR